MVRAKGMTPFLLLLLISPFSTTTASNTACPTNIPDTTDTCISSSQENKLVPIRREVYGDGRIFDITHRYTANMPSFGSENGLGQFLQFPEKIKNGSMVNVSEMKMVPHTGTHVDAPGHFFDHYFDAGFDVDTLDLEVLNGNCIQTISILIIVLVLIFTTSRDNNFIRFPRIFTRPNR
jgi:hypothetical protein